MTTVRIHDIANSITTLGPGSRLVIWFQGCKRRCKGCMSPESRPLDGGKLADLDKLIDVICSAKGIEGITISGGEPFLQVDALYELLTAIREKTNLGIIIYTGNTMEQLKTMKDSKVDGITTGLADLIIDGEYIDDLNDGGSLKGSSNQKVNYITKRYVSCKALYEGKDRQVQAVVSGGRMLLAGVPNKETLDSWKDIAEAVSNGCET